MRCSRLWNLQTHETLSLIETSSSETWSITFGPYPDRLQLATAAGTRGSLVLWKVEAETTLEAEMSLPGVSERMGGGRHIFGPRLASCFARAQAAEERQKGKEKFVLSVAYRWPLPS